MEKDGRCVCARTGIGVNETNNTVIIIIMIEETQLSSGNCSSPHILHPKPIMCVCMMFCDGLVSHLGNIPLSRLAFPRSTETLTSIKHFVKIKLN